MSLTTPRQVNGPLDLRLTCPVCDGARRFRQRGDYLWMLCSCVDDLSLSERARLAHQVDVANYDARQAFALEQDRQRWQKRLGEELCRVLGECISTLPANWLPWGRPGGDRLFGAVTVDGLEFGLLLWEEAPEGELALLVDGQPRSIESLPHLGAVLAELRGEAEGCGG